MWANKHSRKITNLLWWPFIIINYIRVVGQGAVTELVMTFLLLRKIYKSLLNSIFLLNYI